MRSRLAHDRPCDVRPEDGHAGGFDGPNDVDKAPAFRAVQSGGRGSSNKQLGARQNSAAISINVQGPYGQRAGGVSAK